MNSFAWLGRQCCAASLYIIDLSCFLIQALSLWQPQRHPFNRAVYFAFIDHLVQNGIRAVAITTFIAIFVGMAIASQLVFIMASITGAKDLVEILARLILSELGPLITGFIMIGRSCSSIVVDLGNAKVGGELEPLKYLGIEVNDYFVVPRIFSLVISQIALALWFSAIMLLCGMLFSGLIYDFPLSRSMSELLNLITPGSLFRFMLKNFLFGLSIGAIACFHGLAVKNSPTEVTAQMQKAVVRSTMSLLLLDGYFILFTL